MSDVKTWLVLRSFEELTAGTVFYSQETERLRGLVASSLIQEVRNDFYEDDELVAEVEAAFKGGRKGSTKKPE